MKKFRLKGSITENDFMIHVLNNMPKDYDVILDRLENHLTATGDDEMTIDFSQKIESTVQKIKIKKRKKSKKNP